MIPPSWQPTGVAMKALVTGGGGFLGGAIVRLLRERGDAVRSFSRGAYPDLDALGVEQVRGDLADAAAVAAAAEGCDVVFHVAAKAGIWGPWDDYYQANVVGTENVLAACRKHGVRRSWSTPARPASSSTAATRRRRRVGALPRHATTPTTRTRRPWPSRRSWQPTGRSWRRCRCGRT